MRRMPGDDPVAQSKTRLERLHHIRHRVADRNRLVLRDGGAERSWERIERGLDRRQQACAGHQFGILQKDHDGRVVGSFKTAHYRTLRISHDTDAQGTLEEK